MKRYEFILSRRWVGFFLTLLSVIAINSWQQALESYGWDNSFSMAAAKNMAEGHGYCISMASPDDYTQVHYEPLNKWPPGYSVLLLLTEKMTGADWIRAAYILNGIVLTGLVLVFRKMLFQLEFPVWIINLAVFFFGFIPHGFMPLNYSDIVSVLLFMFGCSLLIAHIKTGRAPGLRIIGSAICFACCAWLKYLYILPAFIPLVVVFAYAKTRGKKATAEWSLAGISVAALFVALLLVYQRAHSGSAVFVNSAITGFFPGQLMLAAPLIPGSFMNLFFYDLQLNTYTSLSLESSDQIWRILNFMGLAFMIYRIGILFKKGFFSRENFKSFYALLAVVFAATLYFFLAALTVRLNKHYPDMEWVYLQELRYYAPVCFMLQQFSVFLFLKPGTFFSKTGSIIFRVLLILILAEEVSHGTYFMIKQILIKKEYGQHIENGEGYRKAMQFTREAISAGRPVVVCSNSLLYSNMCSLFGSTAMNSPGSLNSNLPASRPFTLITVINRDGQPVIQDFINQTNTKLAYQKGRLLIFITDFSKTNGWRKPA